MTSIEDVTEDRKFFVCHGVIVLFCFGIDQEQLGLDVFEMFSYLIVIDLSHQ